MRKRILALLAVVAFVACDGQPPVHSTPPRTQPPTLQVTVNAGDCAVAGDEFGLRIQDVDRRGVRSLLPSPSPSTGPAGIVPCPVHLRFEDVPAGRLYWVIDATRERAWGPWTRGGLASNGWKVTVDLTDLD